MTLTNESEELLHYIAATVSKLVTNVDKLEIRMNLSDEKLNRLDKKVDMVLDRVNTGHDILGKKIDHLERCIFKNVMPRLDKLEASAVRA